MNKKEEFKKFIKDNPYLGKSVREGKTTFQKLYELYDIYGEDEDMFKEYKVEEEIEKVENKETISNIINSIKGINMDEVKKNIESLQSAVSFIEDFVLPEKNTKNIVEAVVNPKPLDGLFDD